MNDLKSKVAKGAVWAMLEKFSMKVFTFGVTLVLARLLTPSDYGTVALLGIFTTVAELLVDGGFGKALVQKKNATELDFNSVFYLSVSVSLVMYAVLFFTAPAIARFYNTPELIRILRVVAICLIFTAVNGVQCAELSRKLLFNLSFRINVAAATASACVGITLAILEYGPWALVWSSIASSAVATVAYWYFIAWRPKLMFSWKSVSSLFSFGWKMAVSSMLDGVMGELTGLMIGKFYTKADLAFVNKGRSLPAVAMDSINGTIMRVSFPALAQLQDDPSVMRNAMRKMIQCSTFLVFPMMAGLAVCAPDIIVLLFGEQWREAVPYAQIACWSFALYPFHVINLQAITAYGRSDLFLKLEIIKKALALAVLFSCIRYGVLFFVIIGAVVTTPLSLLINSWPNRKLFGYTIGMQLRDVVPTVLISAVMGIVVWLAGWLGDLLDMGAWRLAIQIPVGMAVFTVLSVAFKLAPAGEYLRMLNVAIGDRLPVVTKLARRFE